MKRISHYLPQIFSIFILAFLLNFVWEELHHVLYIRYKGAEITHVVLLRAALFDASFITLTGAFFVFISAMRRRLWIMFVVGVLFAVCLELWALKTGRWAYEDAMPLIPLLGTGLTPTVQLGLLGYFSLRAVLGCTSCFDSH